MERIKVSSISIGKIRSNKLVEIIPEVYELKNIIEDNPWHAKESVFNHTLTCLEELEKLLRNLTGNISDRLNQKITNYTRKDLLFLAALFHDIAKKETIKVEDGKIVCLNHEEKGALKVKGVLEKFDLSEDEKGLVIQIIKNHGRMHLILDPKNNKLKEQYQDFKAKFSNIFLELILLATADTIKSYLRYSIPDEFNFRMNFYKKIIDNY